MKRTELKRRTPLRSIGRKARSKRARRREVVEFVHRRDRVCKAWGMIDAALRWDEMPISLVKANPPRTCSGPLEVHEIIPRSVWPDGELEESNCLLVCRRHHDWIDDELDAARLVGLHAFSWERP